MFSQSETYQLKCNKYPLKYIGQTGRTFRIKYREHTHDTKTNKQNSKYDQQHSTQDIYTAQSTMHWKYSTLKGKDNY
jgi:hypothetical protein